MNERVMQTLFEIHRDLPREGPGSAESTERALSFIADLPRRPRILDIGCGPGMQTLDLARLTGGDILAVDNHRPYLDQLGREAARQGLAEHIEILHADMAALNLSPETFDLIWAEGSAYLMGFEHALRTWRPLLQRPGFLAASEITWTSTDAPEELRRFWGQEYPSMQDAESNLAAVRRAGYRVLGHFELPTSDWWRHYYTPLEHRLAELRKTHTTDPEFLEVVALEQREIDLYRMFSDYYGYIFYVMQNT